MRYNKFFVIVLTIILMFCYNRNVKAFDEKTGVINQQGTIVTTNGTDTLALKYYDSTAVFCTQFKKTSPAGQDLKCSKINWANKDISVGVAYIIRQVGNVSLTGNAPNNYYYGELAINEYLCNSGVDISNTCVRTAGKGQASMVLNETALEWYNTAMNMKYIEPQIKFSSNDLTFSKSGDNYVSNTLTITDEVDDNNSVATVTSNVGEVSQTGNSFKVSVPVSSVEAGSTVNVTVSASVTKTNYLSQNYTCGSNYQTITPNYVELETKTAKATATGSITAPTPEPETPKGKLIINKYDQNNNPLSGATILVSGAQGYNKEFVTNGQPIVIENLEYDTYSIDETKVPAGYVKAKAQTVKLSENNLNATVTLINTSIKVLILKVDKSKNPLSGATLQLEDKDGNVLNICGGSTCKWVTTNQPYVIDKIPVGTYYLSEAKPAEGYVLNPNRTKIVVSKDGKITADGIELADATVKFSNESTKLIINKVDENGKKLPGAILNLVDEQGNVVKYCTDSNNNVSSCKWETTKQSYIIEGIPAGTYYLEEIKVPKGYILNKEKMKIVISENGKVTVNGKEAKENTVDFINKLIRTQISKVNAVDGRELPGATLQILDAKEKSMSCLIINADGKQESLKECKWVSGKKPIIVLGLSEGTYYLEETIAPEGYELNKNKVEFKVKSDGSVTKVEMKNELVVEVPDTLSARSTLLIAISMFDIALGIGIITYVKKNKIEE